MQKIGQPLRNNFLRPPPLLWTQPSLRCPCKTHNSAKNWVPQICFSSMLLELPLSPSIFSWSFQSSFCFKRPLEVAGAITIKTLLNAQQQAFEVFADHWNTPTQKHQTQLKDGSQQNKKGLSGDTAGVQTNLCPRLFPKNSIALIFYLYI